jgi:threonine synthase
MFYSTRNSKLRLHASEAILKGLSDEGGLFLPEKITSLPVDASFLTKTYPELAVLILKGYLDDFSEEEIREAVNKAYSAKNFPEETIGVSSFPEVSFLELFHGPTLTFKDMALSLLPYLMVLSKAKHPEAKPIHILTATSGDTGSAVLSSFSSVKDIEVSILYPNDGIAPIQEKQMLSFTSGTSRAYALRKANFDDCQTLVKKLLVQGESQGGFTSANSINIGRLLPQIVYYYAGYLSLVKEKKIPLGKSVDVLVPTGNFGDIFAAYLAKKMGLPLGRLIVCSNQNRILTDFFRTGVYDIRRKFYKTNSPSMDILISSNLERLLSLTVRDDELLRKWMQDLREKKFFSIDSHTLSLLKEDFSAFSAGPEETEKAIASCYRKNRYLLDPHTAVAYASKEAYVRKNPKHAPLLIVATAAPFKFPATIADSLGLSYSDDLDALSKVLAKTGLTLPPQLAKVLASKTPRFLTTPKDFADRVFHPIRYEVTVPATSANLGCGFDVCGVALTLENVFSFERSDKDELKHFKENDLETNLVLSSYRKVFEKLSLPYLPVKITQKKAQVPQARGLGSSATCIVAGILGADALLNRRLSREEILSLATEIEGHPDNVAPCLFGGFVASYRRGEEVIPTSYPVDPKLHFLLAIPEEELKTSLARSVLPAAYPLKDVTFEMSRILRLPKALKEGDLKTLCDLFEDKIHVPYRLPLITDAKKVKAIAEKAHLPFTISGAGSSLLLLSHGDEILKELRKESYAVPYRFLSLRVRNEGATIKEVVL